MGNLADFIEQYLRNILLAEHKVELQRRELAKMFRCAPSQINYVLETRFTFDRGYVVESKRGGGGYIRITYVPWKDESSFMEQIDELIPEELSEDELENLLVNMVEKQLISSEEAQLCFKIINRYLSDLHPAPADVLRARFIKALLLVLEFKEKE
mgnify:CR=1 FL=1